MSNHPDQTMPPSLSCMLSQLSYMEQVRLIMTHPFFTGQCPECKTNIHITERAIGNCHCPVCNWTDRRDS
ncbi:hypothetical protein [Acaryochloris sp. CCMEE 5410]|uniref:hypothetical protein n=1 Tax=Acaryochloris sp. CCMEE 5410 TaxID=310037 RepID=UPI0011127D2D|nr:hypothetical protein [Acaryochloris sp. CCMEE 5410]KAI9133287.1 hypothetical protein ON05_008135 [Acaryochloris sp. CCMEE 5410]